MYYITLLGIFHATLVLVGISPLMLGALGNQILADLYFCCRIGMPQDDTVISKCCPLCSEHYLTSLTCLMIRTYKLLLVVTEPINTSLPPPPAAACLQSVCKWPSPRQFLQSANEWSETRSCHPSPRCSWAVESGGEQRGVAVSRVSVVCLPATRDTHGITGHRLYICLIVIVDLS